MCPFSAVSRHNALLVIYHDLKHAGVLAAAKDNDDLKLKVIQYVLHNHSYVVPSELQGSEPFWDEWEEQAKEN